MVEKIFIVNEQNNRTSHLYDNAKVEFDDKQMGLSVLLWSLMVIDEHKYDVALIYRDNFGCCCWLPLIIPLFWPVTLKMILKELQMMDTCIWASWSKEYLSYMNRMTTTTICLDNGKMLVVTVGRCWRYLYHDMPLRGLFQRNLPWKTHWFEHLDLKNNNYIKKKDDTAFWRRKILAIAVGDHLWSVYFGWWLLTNIYLRWEEVDFLYLDLSKILMIW